MNWQTALALSGGAFIGVWARWGLMCLFATLSASWPWAVMSANLLGSEIMQRSNKAKSTGEPSCKCRLP